MRNIRRRAFTLVELLAVLLVAAILLAFAVPALRHYRQGPSVTATVGALNGILHNARQEAVAKNAFVYVALGNRGDTLWIVTFSANDGAKVLDWSPPAAVNLNDAAYRVLTPPRSFRSILLKDQGALAPASLPDAAGDNPNINALAEAAVTVSAGGETLTLNHLLLFTPGGQALSETELNQWLEFGIVAADDPQAADPAVFRVSGNLGGVTVYRN
jgi:prepilin-type N-terminal cleavage/methylation domain-containing protein